jgi:CubicO group peptidase (beta-lactamase class C family)
MNRRSIVWCCLTILLCAGQVPAWAQSPIIPQDVTVNIRARVTNGFTPGIVVGMINSNGTTYFSYGVGNLDSGLPVNEDSVFEIGSITKTFTCTVLSELVLSGNLRLSDPAQNYLPSGVQVPSRNGKLITLQHLATHYSGLPRLPANLGPTNVLNPYVDYTVQNLYDFLNSYQLPRDPGASFEYSNLGMGFLGYLLTLDTGLDYETMIAQRVTQPLGMNDTGITLNARMLANLAHCYSGVVPVQNWEFGPATAGAGALRSTARDLLHYVAANMGLAPTALYPAMTNAHAILAGSFPGSSIGLAWFTTPLPGDQMIWHDGATGGYTSFAGYLQNQKLGVVVLGNSDFDVDDLGVHLLYAAQPLTSIPQNFPMSLDTLRSCVGRFQLADGTYFDIGLTHGYLTAAYSSDNGVAFTLYPSSFLSFFADTPTVQGTAVFATNSQGQVDQLLWTQNGASVPCSRIALPARLAIQHRNGATAVSFTGDTAVNYVLEAGADLVHWLPISTNTIWSVPVIDTNQMSSRFYRLRRP